MITLNPEKMTTAEKLLMMETLWDDLCAHSQLDSPDWHKTVLDSRHQQRLTGEQQPMDWSQAKETIRKQLK